MNIFNYFSALELGLILMCGYLLRRLYRANKIAIRRSYETERYLGYVLASMKFVNGIMIYNQGKYGSNLPPDLPSDVVENFLDIKDQLLKIQPPKDEHE